MIECLRQHPVQTEALFSVAFSDFGALPEEEMATVRAAAKFSLMQTLEKKNLRTLMRDLQESTKCTPLTPLLAVSHATHTVRTVSHSELEALQTRYASFLSASADRTTMDRVGFRRAFAQFYIPWADDTQLLDDLFNVRTHAPCRASY